MRSPDRRRLLRGLLIGLAILPTLGHTPYRQWQIYRQKHLLIGTQKADPSSYPLGRRIAAALADRLPASRARVTRGPDASRLASLLTTGQLDVILLSADEVEALARGTAPFELYGSHRLYTLAAAGAHRLVVRADFPDQHAWRIAAALPPMLEPVGSEDAPLHPGIVGFLAGRAMPEAPPEEAVAPGHRH